MALESQSLETLLIEFIELLQALRKLLILPKELICSIETQSFLR